jgi:hypothetical protein
MKTLNLWLLAAAVLVSASAQAQPILQTRCNVDSLDSVQAERRLNWARKCGLVKNVRDPNSAGSLFDTGIPAYNGGMLMDYWESWAQPTGDGANLYSGIAFNQEINYAHITSLYSLAATSQDRGGDPANYFRWWRDPSKKKPRPLYPTFGSTADITAPNNVQLIPDSQFNPTSCDLFVRNSNGTPGTRATTFYVNGYCEASCYTPEQKVLFSGGEYPILEAVEKRREDLITLSPEATLDGVKLQQNRTYSYTAEFRDSEHPIIELSTASGGLLRVTAEHPVLQGEGRMVQAHSLKVGDDLVRADGTPDRIVSVEKGTHFGKVYNLKPVTQDLVSNILVAQGFLVGSSTYQNDDVGYINRIILHRSIPEAALPR